MSFAEILDTGFRILRDRFLLLLSLSAVPYVPLAVVGAASAWLALKFGVAGMVASGLFFLVWVTVVSPLASAGMITAVGDFYLGRPTTFAVCLGKAWSLMLPLAGTMLLFMVWIFGAVVIAALPGAVLLVLGLRVLGLPAMALVPVVFVRMILCYLILWEVAVLEGRFGRAGLRRSRELMRGNLLRAAGIVFVGTILVGVFTGMLRLALGYIPIAGTLGEGVAQATAVAYTTAVHVVLYFDIRCRKEAFDIDHLARLVEERIAPAA